MSKLNDTLDPSVTTSFVPNWSWLSSNVSGFVLQLFISVNFNVEDIQLVWAHLFSVSLRCTNPQVQMDLQVKDRRSTCSCGTLQDRRGTWSTWSCLQLCQMCLFTHKMSLSFWMVSGFGVWQLLSSEMPWVSSSCLTSRMSKVSWTSGTGWVCPLIWSFSTQLSCCYCCVQMPFFRWIKALTMAWIDSKLSVFQVSYRFMHTAKVQTLFCVATNVTWRSREQSVKKKPVSWQRSTGMSQVWSICTWTSSSSICQEGSGCIVCQSLCSRMSD